MYAHMQGGYLWWRFPDNGLTVGEPNEETRPILVLDRRILP